MSKYIIDANVVLLAGTPVKDIPREQLLCAKKCVDFIQNFMRDKNASLVLDDSGRILKEYRGARKVGNSPNLATVFCNWAHQNMPKYAKDFVHLDEIQENVFQEYPANQQLKEFDPPDRKYIAIAYKHPDSPPIVEASDSKWWGIKEALKENKIEVIFVDEEYIKNKYMKKIGI
ncbi:MAG: hypothetical protein Q4C61_02470 [Lachnospiraceae bacterium]|nr:hypothetical protein [Lachnospiraceae bacterium]